MLSIQLQEQLSNLLLKGELPPNNSLSISQEDSLLLLEYLETEYAGEDREFHPNGLLQISNVLINLFPFVQPTTPELSRAWNLIKRFLEASSDQYDFGLAFYQRMLLHKKGVPDFFEKDEKDEGQALVLLEKAENAKNSPSYEACYEVGIYFLEGKSHFKQSTDKAKEYLRKAALYHAAASYKLAQMAKLENKPKDYLACLETSAKLGHPESCLSLASIYASGELMEGAQVAIDQEKSIFYLKKSAENGNANAQFSLATNIMKGIVSDEGNPFLLYECLSKSAQQGHQKANALLKEHDPLGLGKMLLFQQRQFQELREMGAVQIQCLSQLLSPAPNAPQEKIPQRPQEAKELPPPKHPQQGEKVRSSAVPSDSGLNAKASLWNTPPAPRKTQRKREQGANIPGATV